MTRHGNSRRISESAATTTAAAAPDAHDGYLTPREDYFSPRGSQPSAREREKSTHSGQLFFEAHDPESLTRMVSNARRHKFGRIGFRDRICCYQWTWFTMVSRWLLYV